MKIEQLIVDHLYKSKKVTLQGIGTFKLNPSVILPFDNEKDKNFVMPENAFEFEYNLKAVEDVDLINYIVEHTTKILPLASADLDSYVMLAKQFLNIGKPLVIEGVGTIQKNQVGDYQFIPGTFITPRIDDIPKQAREKRDESVSFESEAPANNNRRNLMIFVTLLIISATAAGIYYMVTQNDTSIAAAEPSTALKKDSFQVSPAVQKMLSDTMLNEPVPQLSTDTSTFKIVLRNYNSAEKAQAAFERLSAKGHNLIVIPVDSSNFHLAMPFTTSLSDTARAMDSLQKIFKGKPFVQL